MKVLFISPYLTMNNIGASVGSWSHLKAIRKIVGRENVIAVALDYDKKIMSSKDQELIVIDSYRSRFEKYMNFFTLNGICMNQRVRNEILKLIGESKIDLIFIDESILGKLAKQVKINFPKVRIISFYHDIKANLCRQWIKNGGIKTIPYNVGLMYNERINHKYVDCKVVLNQRDEYLLQKYYGCRADYKLPHFIIEKEIDIEKYMKRNSNDLNLLFVGADYHPNVQGIKWFIDNVMPRLKKDRKLWIVGKNMEKNMSIFNAPNVNVIGTVPNLEEWYMKSDIIISPIFVGGGMKTKTAEAFQYGKRIVATPESYEGYAEFLPTNFWNKYCWKVDEADGFVEILNSFDIKEIETFNYHIHQVFIDYYSSKAGENRLKKILGSE